MQYLVFDIGGTFIKYALMNEELDILEKDSVPTPLDTQENFVASLKNIYEEYKDQIDGIAVSMPGRIDPYNGYAFTTGSLLHSMETDLVKLFRQFTDLPVSFENDAKCAVLAELDKGALQGVQDGAVLVFGSGVGGGIVKDGKLHRGHNFAAGEFSFILGLNEQGKLGHFALSSNTMSLVRKVAKRKNVPSSTLDGKAVFDLVEEGDEDAYAALVEFCDTIVVQLYNIQYINDPEVMAIGGGISARQVFIDTLNDRIDVLETKLPFEMTKPRVTVCKYRNDANLIGALLHFKEYAIQ